MRFETEIAADAQAPGVARHVLPPWVRDLVGGAWPDLRLVVTEMVANATAHSGGGHVTVVLSANRQRVRIEVRDEGQGFDQPAITTPGGADGGWGLHLIDLIAERWGSQRDPVSLVWAEFPCVASPRPAGPGSPFVPSRNGVAPRSTPADRHSGLERTQTPAATGGRRGSGLPLPAGRAVRQIGER